MDEKEKTKIIAKFIVQSVIYEPGTALGFFEYCEKVVNQYKQNIIDEKLSAIQLFDTLCINNELLLVDKALCFLKKFKDPPHDNQLKAENDKSVADSECKNKMTVEKKNINNNNKLNTMKDLRKCEFKLNGDLADGYFHKFENGNAIIEDKRGRCHVIPIEEIRFTDFFKDLADKIGLK
jgi:hypothetical protein